jgi:hypothetical protein
MGHKLTANEKQKIAKYVREKEQAAHPEAKITVGVGNEVQKDGNVAIRIVRSTITEMPPGWTPPGHTKKR